MEIYTKDLSEKVVKINNRLSFKVEYPTVEQKFKLEQAIQRGVTLRPPIKDGEIDYNNVTPEMLQQYAAAEKYRKSLYLKYTVKGWTGNLFTGENNTPIIENNELSDLQWNALCYDDEIVNSLYEAINKKLRFNETDKKKSISTDV